MAAKALGLDLASKKSRKLSDYPYMEDYRARWSVDGEKRCAYAPQHILICGP
jgi:hypothetical protein